VSLTIRRAQAADAESITELAIRSKAHWGYDDEFMQVSRKKLTITPAYILMNPIFVAEMDGQLAGFYSLIKWRDLEYPEDNAQELDYLFIEPSFIGTGVGRALWGHAVNVAQALGAVNLLIVSDPNAEGFYAKMGAVTFGQQESTSRKGRFLPLMRYGLKL
jgi:GNAT superfamily N-acetyltransferase